MNISNIFDMDSLDIKTSKLNMEEKDLSSFLPLLRKVSYNEDKDFI